MRHYNPSHSGLTHFRSAQEEDLDTLALFDDRTLASLVASSSGGRPSLPCDGRNEDRPELTLPLERWQDRR
jgi:hypothetical protein